MSEKEDKFVKFVVTLWNDYNYCFSTTYSAWTEKYDKDDWAFGVFLRTMIWNDEQSHPFFLQNGKYAGFKKKYLENPSGFEKWVEEQINDIKIGGKNQRGAHRKEAFTKRYFSKAMKQYFDMIDSSTPLEFIKGKPFDDLHTKFMKIKSIRYLTAFDILERLFRSKHGYYNDYPHQFYRTGGGAKRGLELIYNREGITDTEWEELGQEIANKIKENANIPDNILYFEVESILCMIQKDNVKMKTIDFLACELTIEKYAKLYADLNCKSKKPKC